MTPSLLRSYVEKTATYSIPRVVCTSVIPSSPTVVLASQLETLFCGERINISIGRRFIFYLHTVVVWLCSKEHELFLRVHETSSFRLWLLIITRHYVIGASLVVVGNKHICFRRYRKSTTIGIAKVARSLS